MGESTRHVRHLLKRGNAVLEPCRVEMLWLPPSSLIMPPNTWNKLKLSKNTNLTIKLAFHNKCAELSVRLGIDGNACTQLHPIISVDDNLLKLLQVDCVT